MLNKTNKEDLFFVLLGFIIIALIIFFKVFYIRDPRHLNSNLSIFITIIYLWIIINFLCIIIHSIYNILKFRKLIVPKERNKIKDFIFNNFIIKSLILFKMHYYKCLILFDSFIKHNIIKQWALITVYLIEFILKKVPYKNIQYIAWIFDFIPKIIFCGLFSLDVLYYNKFDYSYKVAPILILPLLYSYLLYTIKDFCEKNIDKGKDILLIYHLVPAPKEQISIWKYFMLKGIEVNRNPEKVKYLFSDNYLLNNNLAEFQFGWSNEYIKNNQDHFNKMSDKELTIDFFHQYLGLHQRFILAFLYCLQIETYKEVQLYYIRLFTSIIFFIDWVYIITYGFF